MIVRCPSCGAPVEFRYDDSFVRVCDHCRSAVVRTDRGVETLGKFADLMPMSSALRLFAEGRYGATGFMLVGMAQLRHAAGGVWQEWYAKVDGGAWAWLSEAQGQLYWTFERADVAAPSIAQLVPGTRVPLAGETFTVAERGTATYVSALGEIPYRLVPQSQFQFADLSDGRGGFATIDYGDGSDSPSVYVGYVVTPAGLGLSGGEAPAVAAPVQAARLACPNCNGSLELRVPDQTLRVACPYCNSLISVESGTLSIIARQRDKPTLVIPLGAVGQFVEGELTVVGHVERSAYLDGSWWPFSEYLLHAPQIGYRWLVCSDEHWSYAQPVASGEVTVSLQAWFDGVAFSRFQYAALRVDRVVGEFYWRVEVGETVRSEDYIAPPAMLSREVSANEQTWSLATYMTPREVNKAFGKTLSLATPIGVAPNQPYPAGVGKVMALMTVALLGVGIARAMTSPNSDKLSEVFTVPMAGAKPSTFDPTIGLVPSAPTLPLPSTGSSGSAGSDDVQTTGTSADPAASVMFSKKFRLEGGKNIAFDLTANVSNNWLYAAVDLVNDDTGSVVSFDKSIEYYSGFDSDGSWSEGSQGEREVIAPVEAGNYVLRVEAQHGGVGDIGLQIRVHQGVFRGLWLLVALGILAIPYGLVGFGAWIFRNKRMLNSNAANWPAGPGWLQGGHG